MQVVPSGSIGTTNGGTVGTANVGTANCECPILENRTRGTFRKVLGCPFLENRTFEVRQRAVAVS